ncbi:MAG: glucose-6-phosphate dehydrogenase [Actinobacteria bacterium]|jgi:glucose-6-phosphate 1-dehydrogenase|nr:glucose-6-phosphate dehydrogenase [Actinomycetota bacterium]
MTAARTDALVFFGATGDLVHKELFPALQGLVHDGGVRMPFIGVARSPWTTEQLRARAKDSLEQSGRFDPQAFEELAPLLHYISGDYGAPETYVAMRRALGGARHPLLYMAVPPSVFPVVTDALAGAGSTEGARVMIEKPFGRDLASAKELNRTLRRHFPEEDIFRIDHFLGKEPVQNITYTRFANPWLEPVWNRSHIHRVQITMAEDFGVKNRGRFYEEAGAIRDVVQNHLLQLLAIAAMDPPGGAGPDAIGDEKVRLLEHVQPLEARNVVRGQYRGYRSADGVAPDSTVETYVALKLFIDNWRWSGVPFYIRAGKELAMRSTELFVEFKRPPRDLFGETVPPGSSHLRMRIGPDIAVGFGMRVKVHGEQMVGRDVELALTSCPGDAHPPYQRLLSDAMAGNKELFARQEGIEASWRIVEPVLGDATPVFSYEPGSRGPVQADGLTGTDGPWIDPAPPEPTECR